MENNNKQLLKLAQIFNADKIVTPEDISAVLKGILEIMNSFKKGNEVLNSETKQTVINLLQKVSEENARLFSDVTHETTKAKEEMISKMDTHMKEMKKMCEELMLMKPEDGMDADEEAIIKEVLAQIKLPEYKEVILDDRKKIVDKINAGGTEKINATEISGLPQFTREVVREVGGGFVETPLKAGTNVTITKDAQGANVINATGGGTVGPGTINEIAYFDTANTVASLPVATYPSLTEFSYVKGLTSAVQTQLGNKQPLDTQLTSLAALAYTGNAGKFIRVNAGETDFELATISGTGTVTSVAMTVPTGLTVTGSPVTTAGTLALALDTGYVIPLQTTLDGFVKIDQTIGQTIGVTGARLTKLWATDITVTNAITGSVTGNAGTVTNATLTTALTVNTGAVTLVGNVAGSTLTLGAGASSVSGTNTGDQTTISGNAGTATALQTARSIYGNSFNGTADLAQVIASAYGGTGNGFTKFTGATTAEKTYTLPDASTTILTKNYTGALATGIVKNTTTTGELTIAVAGDFPTLNQNTTGSAATLTTTRTIWGQNFNGSANVTGDITLGVSSITMTGSIAATANRVTKLWATDIESTNMPTVGGTAILTSLTAPQFTTIELGHATDTTLSRVSAGVIAVEGVTIPTISSTSTFTNKRTNPRLVTATSYTTDTGTSLDVSTCDQFEITAQAGALLFNAPGGTPVGGQKLIIRIKDNGTARALTYNAIFRAMGTALPTTTVLSKTLYMGFIYNATDSKWDLVAVAQEA